MHDSSQFFLFFNSLIFIIFFSRIVEKGPDHLEKMKEMLHAAEEAIENLKRTWYVLKD